MNGALLILRLILGLGLAAHGAQKLFGWFGGHGLAGTGGFFEGLGFRPGKAFALLAGLGEMGGGVLLALGLGGPLGPALSVLVMIVAAWSVHRQKGFFAMDGGLELPVLYATGAAAIALAGPGAWSLDAAIGLHGLWTETSAWLALAGGVLVAAG
ncbi:MAG TPA: DoxX family membrane protein, partial [Gemmatimonadota bacterium]|nr:DoxX family membrane protein [Gemmatimonadota bacterium]